MFWTCGCSLEKEKNIFRMIDISDFTFPFQYSFCHVYKQTMCSSFTHFMSENAIHDDDVYWLWYEIFNQMVKIVKCLLRNWNPIGHVWFDGGWCSHVLRAVCSVYIFFVITMLYVCLLCVCVCLSDCPACQGLYDCYNVITKLLRKSKRM